MAQIQEDNLDQLTIVTSTRDNITWVEPFLKSFYQTTFNLNIPIIIVDASSEENHQILLSKTEKYDNVQIVTSPYPIKHWIYDWEYGISQCKTKYILHCHIDIIFLLKNWDIILPELLQDYVVVAAGAYDNITSSFILTTTDLLCSANCSTIIDSDNTIREMGDIIRTANERGRTLLFDRVPLDKIKQIQFGDIFTLENKDVFYHSYYSSRVYPTTCEPIPHAEFISSNISQRNLELVPNILLNYLDNKGQLKDFLIQNL